MSSPVHGMEGRTERARWAARAMLLADLGATVPTPLRLSDTAWLGRLPDWVDLPADARTELALVTGAVSCASVLRRTIDGRVLRPLAERLGSERLSAVMALRVQGVEPAVWTWQDDPLSALTGLGAEVLLREAALPTSLSRRMARLFPFSDCLGQVDAGQLRETVSQARRLCTQTRHSEEAAA